MRGWLFEDALNNVAENIVNKQFAQGFQAFFHQASS
jgi:hypothetical protein